MAKNKFKEILNTLDAETIKHSSRVAVLATYIVEQLKNSDIKSTNENEVTLIEEAKKLDAGEVFRSAFLHDIGKAMIPTPILNYPGKLSEERFNVIKEHPQGGAEILKGFVDLDVNDKGPLEHHENKNGTGYPFGLKEEEISLISKIIAVADRFEAISAQRPYKNAKPIDLSKKIVNEEEVGVDRKNRLEGFLVKALFDKLDNLGIKQTNDNKFLHNYSVKLEDDIEKMLKKYANIDFSKQHEKNSKRKVFVAFPNDETKQGNDSFSKETTQKPKVYVVTPDAIAEPEITPKTNQEKDARIIQERTLYDSDLSRLIEIMDDNEQKKNVAKYYTDMIGKHYASGGLNPDNKGNNSSSFDKAFMKSCLKIQEHDNFFSEHKTMDIEYSEKMVESVLTRIDLEQQMQELSSVVKQLRRVHKDILPNEKHPQVPQSEVSSNQYLADLLKKRELIKPVRRNNIAILKKDLPLAKECAQKLQNKALFEQSAIEKYNEVKNKIEDSLEKKGIEFDRIVISKGQDNSLQFEVKLMNSEKCILFNQNGDEFNQSNKSLFADSVLEKALNVVDDQESLNNAVRDLGSKANKYKFAIGDMDTLTKYHEVDKRFDKYVEKEKEGKILPGFKGE